MREKARQLYNVLLTALELVVDVCVYVNKYKDTFGQLQPLLVLLIVISYQTACTSVR